MTDKRSMAAIGDRDTILLFNAIGIETHISQDVEQVDQLVFSLANKKCKIIFISEDLYQKIPQTIEKYKSNPFPILIPIPITKKSKQIGKQKIRENVEKAIGFDIF
ncbi:MAG: V-type ATP synthase subunit F [Bacilli bacterium]|jgi:V/A-type H+-transporting ATPase subunit F|nr:V-type ATP synthase subunit F [Bacilli bacterium]